MKKILEYLPQNVIKLYFIISFIVGIVLFLILYFNSVQLDICFYLSFGLFVIIFIWSVLEEKLGAKRHISILESSGFQRLKSEGFLFEHFNDYYGITGIYKGYIFDIYYDWSTYIKPKVNRAIVINAYFLPLIKNNGETDIKRLESISKKHNVSNWKLKNWNYWWKDGILTLKNGVGILNPSYRKIINRMEGILKILKEENLLPVDRETLEKLRKEHPNNFVPEIKNYFEKK